MLSYLRILAYKTSSIETYISWFEYTVGRTVKKPFEYETWAHPCQWHKFTPNRSHSFPDFSLGDSTVAKPQYKLDWFYFYFDRIRTDPLSWRFCTRTSCRKDNSSRSKDPGMVFEQKSKMASGGEAEEPEEGFGQWECTGRSYQWFQWRWRRCWRNTWVIWSNLE